MKYPFIFLLGIVTAENDVACSVVVSPVVQKIDPNLKVISDVFSCSYTVKRWKPDDFCAIRAGKVLLEGLKAIVESTNAVCEFICTDCGKNKKKIEKSDQQESQEEVNQEEVNLLRSESDNLD